MAVELFVRKCKQPIKNEEFSKKLVGGGGQCPNRRLHQPRHIVRVSLHRRL